MGGGKLGDYVCTWRLCRLPVGLLGLHVDRGRHEHRHGSRVWCIGIDVVDAVFRHTGCEVFVDCGVVVVLVWSGYVRAVSMTNASCYGEIKLEIMR